MKKWLVITIVIWFISIPFIIISINNYIEKKDERLRLEFNSAVEDIFNNREYIDVVYSGSDVSYEKKKIPNKPRHAGKELLSKWEECYGDLYKMYQIKNDSYTQEDGWELIKVSSSYDSYGNIIVSKQWIFPYAIGYKKQDYYYGYNYAPSVRSAVDETFDFLTTEPKSSIYEDFEKGSYSRIFNEINDANNEYYTIEMDSIPKLWQTGNPLFSFYWWDHISANGEHWNLEGRIVSPMAYVSMEDGYYRVFVGLTQPATWSLKRYDRAVEYDRIQLLRWWLLSSGCLFVIIITILSILLYQRNKKINESDYEKLLRLSHPKNFINPYNKEKVEKANIIYKEVKNVDNNDSNSINLLIQRCIDELGVSFIDQTQLSELKKLVNPKRFMNPYDAQKIQLANQLFSILNSDNISFADFKEVCDKVKKLEA